MEIDRLTPWSECLGVLTKVGENENGAVLHFRHGEAILVPAETGKELKRETGKKVGVLRTDIPNKPYIWREVDAS